MIYLREFAFLHTMFLNKLDNSDFESAKSKANYYLDDLRGYELKIRPSSGSIKDGYIKYLNYIKI